MKHTIYLKNNKTLQASEKDALELMEIIEKKTGDKPQIKKADKEETKPDFYFVR